LEKRQQGTGQWFLNSPDFSAWVRGDIQTLFCPGIPGAGKTVLASIAIEHLRSSQNGDESPVAFLYCNYRMREQQTTKILLATLLRQLAEQPESIPEPVKTLYTTHTEKGTWIKPSPAEILDTLSIVIKSRDRVLLVVDAIDECSENTRREFLKSIRKLQNKTKASLLATSRHIEDIEQQFAGDARLEIQADTSDLEKFLDGQLMNLSKCVQKNLSLQRDVKECIKKSADGM
jgi:Cdc6-like AAA superfamily ATPase